MRKARSKVFHLNCFTCMVCNKQLSTGEELYVIDENKFVCKDDYLSSSSLKEGSLNSGMEASFLSQLSSRRKRASATNRALSTRHPTPALGYAEFGPGLVSWGAASGLESQSRFYRRTLNQALLPPPPPQFRTEKQNPPSVSFEVLVNFRRTSRLIAIWKKARRGGGGGRR